MGLSYLSEEAQKLNTANEKEAQKIEVSNEEKKTELSEKGDSSEGEQNDSSKSDGETKTLTLKEIKERRKGE